MLGSVKFGSRFSQPRTGPIGFGRGNLNASRYVSVLVCHGILPSSQTFSVEAGWFCDDSRSSNAEDLPFLLAMNHLRDTACRRDTCLAWDEAWQSFFTHHSRLVHHFLGSNGIYDSDAEDSEQNIWLQVVSHLRGKTCSHYYRQFLSWLQAVLRTEVARYFRGRFRSPSMLPLSSIAVDFPARDGTPSEACILNEETTILYESLASLHNRAPRMTYEVLRMRMIEDVSTKYVALYLEIPPAEVQYRKYRALRMLGQILRARMYWDNSSQRTSQQKESGRPGGCVEPSGLKRAVCTPSLAIRPQDSRSDHRPVVDADEVEDDTAFRHGAIKGASPP